MVNFLFHSNQLNERGTETSSFFLATKLVNLGHSVTFAFDELNQENNSQAIRHFNDSFPLLPYKNFSSLVKMAPRKFDIAYFVKTSSADGKFLPKIFTANHIVFSDYKPHGNTYTFVSRWVAENARRLSKFRGQLVRGPVARLRGCLNAMDYDYVDHIVDMPLSKKVTRSELGIPEDAFLIIRYGGISTFDIPWVQKRLLEFMNSNNDTYFLAINTSHFVSHPRIKYMNTIVDLNMKSSILSLADVFLHARSGGETFGMAIIESLQLGVPVLAWGGGRDQNHVMHLSQFGLIYNNEFDFDLLLKELKTRKNQDSDKSIQFQLVKYADSFRSNELIDKYMKVLFRLSNTSIV